MHNRPLTCKGALYQRVRSKNNRRLFPRHAYYTDLTTRCSHIRESQSTQYNPVYGNNTVYMVTTLHNLACSAGVFFKRAICSPKGHVETSRREEEIGLLFLLSPIFHCHKMKDGGYSNITYTNKVSPTQNTPALQAIHNLKQMFYCLISGGGYTQVPYDSLLQRLSQS